MLDCEENVFLPELEGVRDLQGEYPVTLCYMPLQWCSDAQAMAISMFGKPNLYSSRYAILFSSQDKVVTTHVIQELKKVNPFLRLVFCSSTVGMGFDSPSISRIVPARPPKTVSDFVQQIGRAGRMGQTSVSIVYFNSSDIARNVQGMSDEMRHFCQTEGCLREEMLKSFGFSHEITDCKCCCNCLPNCECVICRPHSPKNVVHDTEL